MGRDKIQAHDVSSSPQEDRGVSSVQGGRRWRLNSGKAEGFTEPTRSEMTKELELRLLQLRMSLEDFPLLSKLAERADDHLPQVVSSYGRTIPESTLCGG